jgi:phage N-6-adenine-methyltransferase
MQNELMFSSANQAWATRWEDFNKWNNRFNFTLDVCAGFGDQKCENFFTPADNGLAQNWTTEYENKENHFWCNPPYGAQQKLWVNEGFKQKANGVFLIPSRTDTILFHDTIVKGQKAGYCNIEFIKGRITFGSDQYWKWVWTQKELNGKPNSLYKKFGKMNPAPFASMLVKCGNCKNL